MFLDDISAEDYREEIADHAEDCNCSSCQVFERLLDLERIYSMYLRGETVGEKELLLCRKKDQRYQRKS